MTQMRIEKTNVELAKEEIEKRKRNVEGSPISYFWVIPLGNINSSSRKWLEIKGDREAILRVNEAFKRAFREDWTDMKLGSE